MNPTNERDVVRTGKRNALLPIRISFWPSNHPCRGKASGRSQAFLRLQGIAKETSSYLGDIGTKLQKRTAWLPKYHGVKPGSRDFPAALHQCIRCRIHGHVKVVFGRNHGGHDGNPGARQIGSAVSSTCQGIYGSQGPSLRMRIGAFARVLFQVFHFSFFVLHLCVYRLFENRFYL